MKEPLLLSRQDAAGALGVGLSTVEDLIASGELRSLKIKSRRVIAMAHLKAYVAKLDAEQNAAQDQESADA